MVESKTVEVTDMHTAGEPVRIITNGFPALADGSLLTRRQEAMREHDDLRRALMLEPRGHADMYGALVLESTEPTAALATLFMHAGGWSTMCGHATIALARWAVESGRVQCVEPVTSFGLECPCGVVQIETQVEGGRVVAAAFESVPSFVERTDFSYDSPAFGRVTGDIAYGGAYYFIVSAASIGLNYEVATTGARIDAARRVFSEIRPLVTITHAGADDLAFLYGVILTDDWLFPEPTSNICVFGEGQIDRSPTGSGVTARLAVDVLKNNIPLGVPRSFSGASGERFVANAVRRVDYQGKPAIIARVEGQAYYVAHTRFICEADDPFARGFEL